MMKKNPKQPDIRQKGFELAKSIYEATNSDPYKEMKGLVSQIRNTAISIPSNIVDGTSCKTKKNAAPYFVVARGFLDRLDNHIELSYSLGMIDDPNYQNIQAQINSINSLLSGFIRPKKSKGG